jgi:hypothetical protein
MLRLQEFITIIRNTKTIAEERAEYQKEMSAIRESFGVNFISHPETLIITQTQECYKAPLHQHVGPIDQFWADGMLEPNYSQFFD